MKPGKVCRENSETCIKGESSIPGRILLVDDHAAFRSEFRACFEEYEITEACNGAEALEILRKSNRIDLVILDVNMPGMSGIQVLEEIRRTTPDIGIIIQTGYGSKEVFLKVLREKADYYIEKPLNIETTREAIERTLYRLSRSRGETTIDKWSDQ